MHDGVQDELHWRQQELRQRIEQQMRVIETAETPEQSQHEYVKLAELRARQQDIDAQLRAATPVQAPVLLETKPATSQTRGRDQSGATPITVKLTRGLLHLPTAICHLLDTSKFALVRCEVGNKGNDTERVCVRCWVEGYSAQAVRSFELARCTSDEASLLPTFYPSSLRRINELTLATMHVQVEDLRRTEVLRHETYPIWLLARNSAPIQVQLGAFGSLEPLDMRDYLAAFVTPHDPAVVAYLRKVVELHPRKALGGYQDIADAQARAIYDTLKKELKLRYVNSYVDFNPDDNSRTQRVRLPRETLAQRQANCIDGALLFASLLEAISLRPALLTLPGHAIVAWRTDDITSESDPLRTNNKATDWRCLDTLRLPNCDFDAALRFGQAAYASQQADLEFRLLDIANLRRKGITPLT